jgi:hypothetical protein
LRIPVPQKIGAHIVIAEICTFIATKHSRRPRTEARDVIRWHFGSLLLLGQISAHDLANTLHVDRRTLERRRQTDLEAIEWKYADFLRNYVPQIARPLCYSDNNNWDSSAAYRLACDEAGIIPDDDPVLRSDLTDTMERVLFD